MNRHARSGLLFMMLLCLAFGLMCGLLTRGHEWGDDFAAYIMQAKSIVDASPRQYVEASRFTEEMSSYPVGPVVYPWGFPLLLAPVYAIFGLNLLALKFVGVFSYLAFLALLWFGFRGVHRPVWFLCLSCTFALNPTLLKHSDSVLSDVPFLVASTLSLMMIGRTVVEGRCLVSRFWDGVLTGLVIAAATLIRPNGILLLGAVVFAQLSGLWRTRRYEWRQDWKPWGRLPWMKVPSSLKSMLSELPIGLVPYIAMLCSVVLCNVVLPNDRGGGYNCYSSWVSMATFKRNLHYYFALPGEFFSGIPYYRAIYWISIPLALLGMLRRRRRDGHCIVYIFLTAILYLVWPAQQGLRFLLPILPFFLSFLITGMEAVQDAANRARMPFLGAMCFIPVIVVIGGFLIQSSLCVCENLRRNRDLAWGPFATNAGRMFEYIQSQTEKTSVVIFFKPRAMRLLANRRSIMVEEPEGLSRGDYFCLYTRNTHQQMPLVMAERTLKEWAAPLIYENADFKVYRLRRPP